MSFGLSSLTGFNSRRAGGLVTPPSNIVVLLHGDGANGSTSIVDSSSYARTFTAQGNAQLTTAWSAFGGASITIDSAVAVNSNFIFAADAAELSFGSSDFGIGLFCRWPNVYSGNFSPVFAAKRSVASNFEYSFYYLTGELHLVVSANGVATSDLKVSWTPVANTSYYIEVNRIGGAVRFFVGEVGGSAVQIGSDQAIGGTIFSGTSSFCCFADGNNVCRFNGYFDELIVSNGSALHSAGFSVPTAPFYVA